MIEHGLKQGITAMYINKLLLFSFCLVLSFSSFGPHATAQDRFTHTLTFESSKSEYNWQVTPWSECADVLGCDPATRPCFCGTEAGDQTRNISCVDNLGNLAPSLDDCKNIAPEPARTRRCDLPDCQWQVLSCSTLPPQQTSCTYANRTYQPGQSAITRTIMGERLPGYGNAYMYGSAYMICQSDGTWGPEQYRVNPEANGPG